MPVEVNSTLLFKTKKENKAFKEAVKKLLAKFGYHGADRILIHLGENCGVKGGEITKYF